VFLIVMEQVYALDLANEPTNPHLGEENIHKILYMNLGIRVFGTLS
jgi:hypothetical protein